MYCSLPVGLGDLCEHMFVISGSAGVFKSYISLTNELTVILEYYNDRTNLDNIKVLNKFTKLIEALEKTVSNITQLECDRSTA